MVERRHAEDRQSTYSWVNSLSRFQGRYDKLISAMAAHLDHAQNLQPVQGAIPTIVEELLNGAKITKAVAEQWHQEAKVAQARDMSRVNDPIGGSADRERRGDAGWSARDV